MDTIQGIDLPCSYSSSQFHFLCLLRLLSFHFLCLFLGAFALLSSAGVLGIVCWSCSGHGDNRLSGAASDGQGGVAR